MSTVIRAEHFMRTSLWGLPRWYVFICLVAAGIFAATQSWLAWSLLALPALVRIPRLGLTTLFMVLMGSLALSTEQYLPMGLASDLPAEQLMWYMTVAGLLIFWYRWTEVPVAVVRHPILLLATLIPLWIMITAITSIDALQSVKYLMAKLWYMVAMFYLPIYILRDRMVLRRAMKWLIMGTLITVAIIMARHALEGFSFAMINSVLSPFYRNHVDYACLLALVLPFMVWYRQTLTSRRWRHWMLAAIILVILANVLSYTRAAIIAMMVSPSVLLIIRWRLSIPAITAAILIAVGSVYYIMDDYRYMAHAPDFENTVHHKDFGTLLQATTEGADVSTMERFYRWLAGAAMFEERPMMGVGAANFVKAYHSYTNKSFRTWVSDNEGGSGIHNYFLMLLVEQGLIGLLLFLGVNIAAFVCGQRDYHRIRDPIERGLVMAALTAIFVTLLISLMNDMIEAQKVGTIYFLCLAILVRARLVER